jgi:hypothetical protein
MVVSLSRIECFKIISVENQRRIPARYRLLLLAAVVAAAAAAAAATAAAAAAAHNESIVVKHQVNDTTRGDRRCTRA